ncbi:MAG: hypothetical protein QOK43_539 [Acidimicrobiaceae bacterium]|nr:hypothetical protein [Acidimicrobiaceae bacterium]
MAQLSHFAFEPKRCLVDHPRVEVFERQADGIEHTGGVPYGRPVLAIRDLSTEAHGLNDQTLVRLTPSPRRHRRQNSDGNRG